MCIQKWGKDMNSKRNRHTGRVNSAKQYVLDKGVRGKDSRGVWYAKLQTGLFGPKGMEVPVYTIVKV